MGVSVTKKSGIMKRAIIAVIASLAMVLAYTACKKEQGNDKKGLLEPGAMIYINVTDNGRKAGGASQSEPTPSAAIAIAGGAIRSMNRMDSRIEMEYLGENRDTPRTPREIVEQSGGFMFTNPDGIHNRTVGIGDEQKDFENNRIKMWGEMIITSGGELDDYWITLRDVRIMGYTMPPETNEGKLEDEILAYIPNAVMAQAEKDIRREYAAGNYTAVYELFHKTYDAIPITTKAWKALKAKGEN